MRIKNLVVFRSLKSIQNPKKKLSQNKPDKPKPSVALKHLSVLMVLLGHPALSHAAYANVCESAVGAVPFARCVIGDFDLRMSNSNAGSNPYSVGMLANGSSANVLRTTYTFGLCLGNSVETGVCFTGGDIIANQVTTLGTKAIGRIFDRDSGTEVGRWSGVVAANFGWTNMQLETVLPSVPSISSAAYNATASDVAPAAASSPTTGTFFGLNFNVADNMAQDCTVSACRADGSGVTNNQTVAISMDANDDITTSNATNNGGFAAVGPVTSGDMSTEVVATRLVFGTQPSNSAPDDR